MLYSRLLFECHIAQSKASQARLLGQRQQEYSIKAGKPASSTYVQVPPKMIRCLVIGVIRRVVLYPSLGQEQLSPTPREERIEDGQVEANPQREETELTLNTWTSKLILLANRLM